MEIEMKHYHAHKSGLFLLELLFAIVIFALSGAVCLQLFVKAHLLSGEAQELNRAVNLCISAAEAFRAGRGDVFLLQQALPGLERTGEDSAKAFCMEAFYNEAFTACKEAEGAYRLEIAVNTEAELSEAEIELWDSEENEVVYELSVNCHVSHRGDAAEGYR